MAKRVKSSPPLRRPEKLIQKARNRIGTGCGLIVPVTDTSGGAESREPPRCLFAFRRKLGRGDLNDPLLLLELLQKLFRRRRVGVQRH